MFSARSEILANVYFKTYSFIDLGLVRQFLFEEEISTSKDEIAADFFPPAPRIYS